MNSVGGTQLRPVWISDWSVLSLSASKPSVAFRPPVMFRS